MKKLISALMIAASLFVPSIASACGDVGVFVAKVDKIENGIYYASDEFDQKLVFPIDKIKQGDTINVGTVVIAFYSGHDNSLLEVEKAIPTPDMPPNP